MKLTIEIFHGGTWHPAAELELRDPGAGRNSSAREITSELADLADRMF